MLQRRCHAITERGDSCRQAPLHERDFCYWHDPENAEEASEARRVGGLRRRKERALGEAYSLEGLDAVAGARRLVELAVTEALLLENTLPRARLLVAAAHAVVRLLEVGELEERIKALESALGPRLTRKDRR